MTHPKNDSTQNIRLKNSLLVPTLLIIIIWFIKFLEFSFDVNLNNWGLLARNIDSIWNILTSPLVHADWEHLFSNTIPLFLLCWCIFYFYEEIAYKIFLCSYLGSGLLLWIISNRYGYHIGMSGLIYAFAAFIFISGILRKYAKLIAISLIVVFLYGYLIWGILPIDKKTSYEGHFAGAIVGILLGFIFRKQGPQRPIPSWELEENDENEEVYDKL